MSEAHDLCVALHLAAERHAKAKAELGAAREVFRGRLEQATLDAQEAARALDSETFDDFLRAITACRRYGAAAV